ncbi:MAG: TRAP transporter small permease [Alphaproteobacteria bacterium]|nr:TRAP transporter small permease [Alphaproteobacteria bacterium]
MGDQDNKRPETFVFLRKLIEIWALLGGAVLLGIVATTSWSLIRDILWKTPVQGENEIVQVGLAVAVFAFLPLCQVTGANITADIFTSRSGPRTIAVLTMIASLVAFVFALLLVWRSWDGLLDYRELNETTAIMQFPIWTAFIPILMSLALLVVASAISIHDAWDDYKALRMPDPILH